ncbi:MAG: hypothetical protein KDE20_27215, partial [Caldilineaceae bacterium]|nr:hypothetical protein [Caldilineaceae bacterium]
MDKEKRRGCIHGVNARINAFVRRGFYRVHGDGAKPLPGHASSCGSQGYRSDAIRGIGKARQAHGSLMMAEVKIVARSIAKRATICQTEPERYASQFGG